MEFFNFYSSVTGIATLVFQLVLLAGILWMFLDMSKVRGTLEQHGVLAVFLFSLVGMVGSLIFSIGFQLPPCTLCWWQRIFLYPIVFLTGGSLFFKIGTKHAVLVQSGILAGIGFLFSLYHSFIQWGLFAGTGTCGAGSVSCTVVDVLKFGYITIPVMCGTLFALIIFSVLHGTWHKK